MSDIVATHLFWSCIFVWVYVYSIVSSSSLLLSFVGGIVLFSWVKYVSIPRPEDSIVEEILGCDPWLADRGSMLRRNTYTMRVVAHRGAANEAPENTLSAIRHAKKQGCTAIEFDVAFTADNEIILFHDETVDRISNGSGKVTELTWAELRDLDISMKPVFGDKYKGERIALFDDAIELCITLDLRIFIEVKYYDSRVLTAVLNAYKNNAHLYNRAAVISFNPLSIYSIRRADPRIVCCLAWRPFFFSAISYSGEYGEGPPRHTSGVMQILARTLDVINEWLLEYFSFYVLGISVLVLHKDIITPLLVEHWRRRGVRVIAWTVNMPLEKQYFSQIVKVTYMTDALLDDTNLQH